MPILDQSGNAIRQRARLPGACARKHQGGSIRVHDRLKLGSIQQPCIVDAIALARTRRLGSGEDELLHGDRGC